jgi:hypothetical protein
VLEHRVAQERRAVAVLRVALEHHVALERHFLPPPEAYR